MAKKSILFILLFLLFIYPSRTLEKNQSVFQGLYLGQNPPGMKPELFAPGIISTGMFTRDLAMTPDGNEIYFCVAIGNYSFSTILVTRQKNNSWTEPEIAPYMENPNQMNLEPFITPDGKKFFFLSNRADETKQEKIGDQDIWVMDRTENGWSEPYNLGEPINTENAEFFPSVTRDGTIYFTRSEKGQKRHYIYRSRLANGKYTTPEKLPQQVNSGISQFNAFIAPDESYLIVPVFGRKDSLGGTDYYLVIRNNDDSWQQPINLGKEINTPGSIEFSPYVSPDGKYFFFMSSRTLPEDQLPAKLTYQFLHKIHNKPQNGYSDIYWVDAKIIYNLINRPASKAIR